MKKSIMLLGAMALIFASCAQKETNETSTTETTVVTDTVVRDATVVPAPAEPAVEDTDGTSVSVNGDGISVDSKDGTNKTTVEVKDGSGSVEVKR